MLRFKGNEYFFTFIRVVLHKVKMISHQLDVKALIVEIRVLPERISSK